MLKEGLSKVQGSEAFKAYKQSAPGIYLSSVFIILLNTQIEMLQYNYYHEAGHKIAVFDSYGKVSESGVFQKEEKKLEPLDIDAVKIDVEKAVAAADKSAEKVIAVLQMLDGKPVWNLSFLKMPDVVNVKVDAVTGKVIEEKTEKILITG